MHGIPNPHLSHPPFLATPLANLNPPTQWPKDELMDAAKKRFRRNYPATPSISNTNQLRYGQN
ncbi:hypothetical protein [Bartonella sp. HY761]|uniref:hypothetical protein n=1 Tax=Bartonella sp. HY761 TaxID=2979330 RepID=UPI00220A719D|nr:hypothetical protein [Bartonella sp. HY761]UXN07560.1 hypothetical protein N6A79_06125 [Bartonella sp. HY761]